MADTQGQVLIVDDNKVNRLLLARNVELLGHRAEAAENGKIAMEQLRTGAFDLILLDIEMPEMDGFEVLAAIKAAPDLRDIPVIVTSSLEGLDNIVRCIELGAEDYLPKPVNQVLLGARLNSSLEKKRLRDEQKRLLDRFATQEVALDLQNSGFAIGGRRITASVLFCDIRDFTALSEDLPPETTIELLNTYYTLMFDAVGSNGGIVNLMIGDGLMALFGAPRPLENPALNAVAAAKEMFSMIAVLNQQQSAAGSPEIKLGAGIATGEVVAGYAGTDERAAYTCVGKTVNLAARLEAHTKASGRRILVDMQTRNSLPDPSVAEKIQQVEFKGFSERQDIFAL